MWSLARKPAPTWRSVCWSTLGRGWRGSRSRRAVEVVDELPHSATGKVAKGRLRASEARRAMGLQ